MCSHNCSHQTLVHLIPNILLRHLPIRTIVVANRKKGEYSPLYREAKHAGVKNQPHSICGVALLGNILNGDGDTSCLPWNNLVFVSVSKPFDIVALGLHDSLAQQKCTIDDFMKVAKVARS